MAAVRCSSYLSPVTPGTRSSSDIAFGRHVHFGVCRALSAADDTDGHKREVLHVHPKTLLVGDRPPPSVPSGDWQEIRDVITLREPESITPRAFFDRGERVSTAVGDPDGRTRIVDRVLEVDIRYAVASSSRAAD